MVCPTQLCLFEKVAIYIAVTTEHHIFLINIVVLDEPLRDLLLNVL